MKRDYSSISITDIWERIYSKIKEKRYTLSQVSEKLGIPEPTLKGWKQYNRLPDALTILNMADLFNVSFKWLLTGEGEEKEKIVISEKEEKFLADLTEAERFEIQSLFVQFLRLTDEQQFAVKSICETYHRYNMQKNLLNKKN